MKKVLVLIFAGLIYFSASAQRYKGNERKPTVEEKLNDLYCSGMFKSSEGTILDVSSNPNAQTYINILDWLPGRVAGLQVYTSGNGVSIPVIRGSVPGVYIDEMPVPLSFLSSLSSFDVAMIKVIKSPFYGGFNGSGGAIAIYTKVEEEE